MKSKLITLFLTAIVCNVFAQFPETNFQSSSNQYYWKNRKPIEGYWQQDVHYKINASLDDKTDIIDANEELTYYNNSPDELSFVYFHLYNNAQTKGSYLEDLYKNNNIKINAIERSPITITRSFLHQQFHL